MKVSKATKKAVQWVHLMEEIQWEYSAKNRTIRSLAEEYKMTKAAVVELLFDEVVRSRTSSSLAGRFIAQK